MQFVEPVDLASHAVLMNGHQSQLAWGECQNSSTVDRLFGDRLPSVSLGSTLAIARAFGLIASEIHSAFCQLATWITKAKRD